MKDVLNAQEEFWESTFSETPDMFGEEPAYPARKAADLFKKEGRVNILELGGGQGRDTFFFAKNGFRVHVLDYSDAAIRAITSKAQSSGLSGSIIQRGMTSESPFLSRMNPSTAVILICCTAWLLPRGSLRFSPEKSDEY